MSARRSTLLLLLAVVRVANRPSGSAESANGRVNHIRCTGHVTEASDDRGGTIHSGRKATEEHDVWRRSPANRCNWKRRFRPRRPGGAVRVPSLPTGPRSPEAWRRHRGPPTMRSPTATGTRIARKMPHGQTNISESTGQWHVFVDGPAAHVRHTGLVPAPVVAPPSTTVSE